MTFCTARPRADEGGKDIASKKPMAFLPRIAVVDPLNAGDACLAATCYQTTKLKTVQLFSHRGLRIVIYDAGNGRLARKTFRSQELGRLFARGDGTLELERAPRSKGTSFTDRPSFLPIYSDAISQASLYIDVGQASSRDVEMRRKLTEVDEV